MKSRDNFLVFLIAAAAAVAVFGDNISQIWANKTWMVFYVLIDFFLLELIFLILLLRYGGKLIGTASRGVRETFLLWRRDYRPALAVTIFIAGALTVTLHQGYWYAKGKAVKWKLYSNSLIERASDAFATGRPAVAELHLEVGMALLESQRCREAMGQLKKRESVIENGRTALGIVGKNPWVRMKILTEMKGVSGERGDFASELETIKMRNLSRREDYVTALQFIANGSSDEATAILKSIWRDCGDIWHCSSLVRCLEESDSSDHLNAIRTTGPERFAQNVFSSFDSSLEAFLEDPGDEA